MKTPVELRASAARCRRLSNGMGNPDDARSLATLALEFDAEATMAEAAVIAARPKPGKIQV